MSDDEVYTTLKWPLRVRELLSRKKLLMLLGFNSLDGSFLNLVQQKKVIFDERRTLKQ